MKPTSLLKLLLTYLCIGLITCPLFGQSLPIIHSEYLEKDDGLVEQIVNFVIRDAQGYFYFFTDNNIQRFDGEDFFEVDVSLFQTRKIRISDILSVDYASDRAIVIKHKSDTSLFTINPKGVKLFEPIEITYAIGPEEKGKISVEGSSYYWTDNGVYKEKNGKQFLLHELNLDGAKLSFVRSDLKGNLIAAYAARTNYIDYVYVLDKNEVLHDFTFLANEYELAKDLYAADVFYKLMMVGYTGIKVITLKREGVDFFNQSENIKKGEFGRIMMGVVCIDGVIYYNSERKIYFKHNPKKELTSILEQNSFPSLGFGGLRYNQDYDLTFQFGYNYGATDLYQMDFDGMHSTQHRINKTITDLHVKSDIELILIGSYLESSEGCILKYNLVTKEEEIIKKDLPPLRSIFHDSISKQYWIGSHSGLYVYDEDWNLLALLNNNKDGGQHISFDNITTIYKFNDNILAGTTAGGVYVISSENFQILNHYSKKEGLTNNRVASIISDDNNNCWVSTFNGLNVFDSKLNLIKKIYEFQGLPHREFNTFASAKDNLGNLYFGSLNGLLKINPDKVLDWEESYQLTVNSINYFDNERSHALDLSEKNRSFSADSISISYSITDFYKYPYAIPKTEFNVNQNDLELQESPNNISLSNVKPGNLSLSLSTEFATDKIDYNFSIVPNYRRYYSWALTLLSVLGLSLLISYFIIKRNKTKAAEKAMLNKKISELQLSALQGQMNPHFIFNALGAIQYFIQTNDVNKADGYLSDFALLMRGILDSSSKKFITLKEEIKLLKLYIGLEQARFENKFDVHFKVSEDLDEETLIPPMIIQPYIENAITHGIHHLKSRRGRLDIGINQSRDLLKIVIKDNGVGRAAAKLLSKAKKHESRGMSITSDRIETLNRTRDINISLRVNDLFNLKTPIGTEVVLLIND